MPQVEAERGQWRQAMARLGANKTALAFLALFLLVVVACLLAPVWAREIAHTTPSANHVTDTVRVDGKVRDVVAPDGVPTGPTWQGRFFLGADDNGRDIMVRLLYGGRTSLAIGFLAAIATMLLALVAGTAAGYFRGWIDAVLSRVLEIVWAYPVILLGIALGTALSLGGIDLGIVEIHSGSIAVPILVIALVYVPYVGRPIRGRVLALREQEFVDAARTQGAGPVRIMVSEIGPNLTSTLVVFFPLMVANAILLEAALSFLGAGVQKPRPSWGTMIGDGVDLITAAPHLTIVPGAMLVLCVLGLNVFGDGVRDALDPRARIRVEH